MTEALNKIILNRFKTKEVEKEEIIQTLWSSYGKIVRLSLSGGEPKTLIVKNILLPTESNHPRGWNTNQSHLRKIKSYQVEVEWYQKWADRCSADCRVPNCYYTESMGEEHTIILEDLDVAGFPIRKSSLNQEEAQLGLKWLANFHARFMNELPNNLWKEGTYWHLATRPDELAVMEDGKLKEMASKLDQVLRECRFQTIIHGDAKVANFCFSKDMKQIAAVDFQYVGGGCGMKDVVYFLGSCLSEFECEQHEDELLQYYFKELEITLIQQGKKMDFSSLEQDWRTMYSIAWADFTRFLLGWMPTHQKINRYSLKMIERASSLL
ncbi:MAG: DUF1679 domain-containing protein [Flavobacteriales bacterium]|nr:DUF1679 domain-containing protein [Flavobacteriales bacterium]